MFLGARNVWIVFFTICSQIQILDLRKLDVRIGRRQENENKIYLILCGTLTLMDTFKFFFKILRLITWIEQNQFWPSWDLSPGYPDHFPIAVTITKEYRLFLWRALNSTYFKHHWLCPICLVHLIKWKSQFEKKRRSSKCLTKIDPNIKI